MDSFAKQNSPAVQFLLFFRKGLKQALPSLQKIKAPPSEGLFYSVRGVAGSHTYVLSILI